jgi:hypothetical protein
MTALETALLTGGFTLGGVALTFIGSLFANRQTIRAGVATTTRALDAAHDDKIWDKRTATYEEISAYLLFIQAKRRLEARRRFMTFDKEYEEATERLVGDYTPASWWELQARLAVYGSPEVLARFEASHNADTEVAQLVFRLLDIKKQQDDTRRHGTLPVPDLAEIKATRADLDRAHRQADETDQGLVKLMRAELNLRPSNRDTDSAGAIASHRRWQLRHRRSLPRDSNSEPPG